MTLDLFGVINKVKPTTKVTVTFGVIQYVTATCNKPVTFWSNELGQTDHKGHRDFWGHKQNRSTEGCSKLKRSVDMTSSGKDGLNIRTNASPKWDRTRCPEE